MDDETFVKEIKVLWQNSNDEVRNALADMIRTYYNTGCRADMIIGKMQESI